MHVFKSINCLYFSEKQAEDLDTSRYESDDEQQLNDRVAKAKEAEARENLRIKSAALKRKLASKVGSPVCTSKKAQPGSSQTVRVVVEPPPKKNKPVKKSTRPVLTPPAGIAKIVDIDNLSVLQNSDEDDEDMLRISGVDSAGKSATPASQNSYTIPRKDKTSDILPQRFWPSDMAASQIDKLSVDQVHALRKLELDEMSLKKEDDLPGLVIKPTELYLPEVQAEGGTHDFVKKIVAASMLHFPIGPPDDWWEHVPIEWKTVTGKIL